MHKNEFTKEADKKLQYIITEFTGMDQKTVNEFVAECGIKKVFEIPWTIKGMTKRRKEKLDLLQDFVSLWNQLEFLEEEIELNSSTKTGKFFQNRLSHKMDKEYMEIAYCNTQNKLINIETTTGTLGEVQLYRRELAKSILANNAHGIIMAHTHPGGSTNPSAADVSFTRQMRELCNLLSVKILDHIIVTKTTYYSFAENGML